jgi:hypothetical protein
MKLDELHVYKLCTGSIGKRVAVARTFPTVAGNPVRTTDPTRRENDRFRSEDVEPPVRAIVGKNSGGTTILEDHIDDRVLHVHCHAQIDRVVLQRANQLQARAIADVRQTWIPMAAEVTLIDPSIRRSI